MVWFRSEFPWLDRGFIHAVAEDAADDFSDRLRALGFTVATLRTPAGSNFAVGLYAALGISEHRPSRLNWDAVHDDFRDLQLPSRFALVWRQADEFAARDTKVFAEACAILTMEFDERPKETQAVLVLTGTGPGFGSPERPVGRRFQGG